MKITNSTNSQPRYCLHQIGEIVGVDRDALVCKLVDFSVNICIVVQKTACSS